MDVTLRIGRRRLASLLTQDQLTHASLLECCQQPYFVPESTPLATQLINFQKEKRRLGLVVDEYGDVLGIEGGPVLTRATDGLLAVVVADVEDVVAPAASQHVTAHHRGVQGEPVRCGALPDELQVVPPGPDDLRLLRWAIRSPPPDP